MDSTAVSWLRRCLLGMGVVLLASAPAQAGFSIKGSPPGAVTITQTSDGGFLIVRLGDNMLTVSEGLGQQVPGIPKNIKVVMLPGAGGPLTIDLDQALPGSLDLRIPDVADVNFNGDVNSIGGSLKIKAGGGSTNVDLGINQGLTIGKNLIADLGTGGDVLRDNGNPLGVNLGVKLVGVNLFEIQDDMLVGKNLSWNGKKDPTGGNLLATGGLFVDGSLKYLGGNATDSLRLAGSGAGTRVGKNLIANLGDDLTGMEQSVDLGNGGVVEGKLSLKAQGPVDGADLNTSATTRIGKNIAIQFTGPGTNTVVLRGDLGGKSIKYTGGAAQDFVDISVSGPIALKVKLADGEDTLSVSDSGLTSLKADFGPGTDTFLGPANPPYPAKLKNLP